MHEKNENVFYYITTMNENYSHPEMPKDKNCEEGILKGMYKIKEFKKYKKTKIQLLGSGTILREMMSAAEILQNDYQIDSEIWSCLLYTSPSPRDQRGSRMPSSA